MVSFEDEMLRKAHKRIAELEEAALAVAGNTEHPQWCGTFTQQDCNCGLDRLQALLQETAQ